MFGWDDAIMLGAKVLPGVLGGIFGKKKQGVPDWLQPYLSGYKDKAIGGYEDLIAQGQNPGKVYKGLKQEALAAMGKGKYAAAGFGPIGQQVLNQLVAKQASQGKAMDRSISMNYAAAGTNTGLLPAVKAQAALEREQNNELANSNAVSNVALGSVTNFQNEKRAQQDYMARLQAGLTGAEGTYLSAAQQGGQFEQQHQQPGLLSQIMTGIGAAAPGILSGLTGGGKGASGDSGIGDETIDAIPPDPALLQTLSSKIGIPNTYTPLGAKSDSVESDLPYSTVPNDYSDWWKKYGKKGQM
jgi:hypothetical protein